MEQIFSLCPHLSSAQIFRICDWYNDDKYGTPGVDIDVLAQIQSQAGDLSKVFLEDKGKQK